MERTGASARHSLELQLFTAGRRRGWRSLCRLSKSSAIAIDSIDQPNCVTVTSRDFHHTWPPGPRGMNGEVFWSADERLEDAPMTAAPVERNIEREYRTLVSDNLRWRHFTSRPGDIFVCTPAKCGTTWEQTIVSSLLFADGRAPGPVTEIAPWIEARFETIEV